MRIRECVQLFSSIFMETQVSDNNVIPFHTPEPSEVAFGSFLCFVFPGWSFCVTLFLETLGKNPMIQGIDAGLRVTTVNGTFELMICPTFPFWWDDMFSRSLVWDNLGRKNALQTFVAILCVVFIFFYQNLKEPFGVRNEVFVFKFLGQWATEFPKVTAV